MIIELVGIPAAGKTTLARQVVDSVPGIEPTHPSTRGSLGKVISKLRAATTYVRATSLGIRSLSSDSRPWSQKLEALRWLISTFESYTDSNYNSHSVILAEGPIQRSILLFFDAKEGIWNEQLLTKYLDCAPRSDLIIYMDIEPATALQRYKLRSKTGANPPSRFDRSPVDLLVQFRTMAKVLEKALTELSAAGAHVIRVESAADGVAVARAAVRAPETST